MTPDSFRLGMTRLQTCFRVQVDDPTRKIYFEALAMIDDAAWEALVLHAERAWKSPGRLPTPGQFFEWAGIEVETPAQAAQRTTFDGKPVLRDQPLEKAIDGARSTGVGSVPRTFWKSESERLVYENAAEEVMRATVIPSVLPPDWIMGRLDLISRIAQSELKKMEAM